VRVEFRRHAAAIRLLTVRMVGEGKRDAVAWRSGPAGDRAADHKFPKDAMRSDTGECPPTPFDGSAIRGEDGVDHD
jgi:hypothetical protein